jgi:hypothetical protein
MKSELVLVPACGFAELSERLFRSGWQCVASAAHPLVPGEPEHAVFERDDQERIHYTFNPVCQLRVLEIARELDPATRASLPRVDSAEVESWLTSADERILLRGVLAARLMPDAALIERVESLRKHPRAAIAQAAARVSEEIHAVDGHGQTGTNARSQALGIIEILKAQVAPLLQALSQDYTGVVLNTVKPMDADYAKAFVGAAAESARQAYDAIWKQAGDMQYPESTQTQLICDIAPAGMLAYDNELSRRFPGGYRSIAHLLDPHRVWVRWKYVRPGETAGMAYDGLAWLDDHWAWFPKPYRVLAQIARISHR